MSQHYNQYITSQAWYALKDTIRVRALSRCEWCHLRAMDLLHHRSYVHVGVEPEADVMGLCSPCHAVIHGHRASWTLLVHPESLAARGDSGNGLSALWLAYVQACVAQQATAKLTHLSGWAARAPQWAGCGNPYAFICTAAAAHVTCPACLQVIVSQEQEQRLIGEMFDRAEGKPEEAA